MPTAVKGSLRSGGWGKTIQQLFEENGVSAYFHGHDHGFVYEKRPDAEHGYVVYQSMPSAGTMNLFGGIYDVNETDPAYDTIAQRSGNGHVRVTVGSDAATVDYILTSGAVDYSYEIEPSEPSDMPSISVTGSLSAFSSLPGAPSAPQNYTLSGSNLTEDILITSPADFEISLASNGGWTSSLQLDQSGGSVASTPIYVRFNRAGEGASSGNIVHSSDGATTRNVAVTGTAAIPSGDPISFTGEELLGRPTDTTMSIKVVPDEAISLYYEYGTTSGLYPDQTATETAVAGQPKTTVISGLTANTKYYYRMKYSSDGGSTWVTRDEHSFWTQRAKGSTFTFDITTDSHIGIQLGTASNWRSTLNGVAFDQPDFLVDLGDTVAMDDGSTTVPLGNTAAAEQEYKDTLPYFNSVSASSPIFLVAGNHEEQEAWHLQGTLANSLPIMGKNAEKKFYLNPTPNSFYGGDSRTMPDLSGDQLVQDYYSWTWGDALFVVISPFWTTETKPYTTTAGGGETDATGSGDRWDWTLGADQFNWLKSTLANSHTKYKFVFSHQMIGGNGMTSPVNQVNYGHGGVDSANFVEWGGYDTNGTTYAWSDNRDTSVWGNQPIREMLEANGVTAFFHGHDHQMAYETANDMTYQACPSGSFTGGFGNYTTGNTYTVRDSAGQTSIGRTVYADSSQGPGRLRVTVGPGETEVEFVRYNQTSTAAYSYDIAPTEVITHTLTYNAGAGGVINGDSAQVVNDGADGTQVTAVPDAGYHFVKWSDDSTANPRTDANVTADVDVTAVFEVGEVPFGVDGAPTSGLGAANASSVSFSHTTGTGTDRLMLVGVSWHTGTTDRTISSVTFTPTGGSPSALNEVFTQSTFWLSYPRYSAIYKLLDPPKGVTGTVTVTFSGTVSGGIVAGAVDFAGVDQTTPLGTPNGGASLNGSAPTVTLSGLNGNELVFDNVYLGADDSLQTLSPGSGQTSLWNGLSTNICAAASTRQATGSSATMSWTAEYANSLAIAAVPINPKVSE